MNKKIGKLKLEKGDDFEVKFAKIINELVPNYEEIWGIFIGYDGVGGKLKVITT